MGCLFLGFGALDVADGAFDGAVGIGENLLRLTAGTADNFVASGLQIVVETLVFLCHLVEKLVGYPQLFSLTRNFLLVELQLLQLVLEIELLTSHLLTGTVEHIFWKTDAFCNLEGEAGAGMSHGEAVEGTHGVGIEQHGAVDDAGEAVGHQLEVGKVGGHHAEGAAVVQCLEYGFGDGATGARLGAAAQLVEEEEGILMGVCKKCFHVLQMGGVGGEVVVD